MENLKRVIVTGGNAGIGAALCRQLVAEDNCFCYLGCRSIEKGQAAVADIVTKHPECKDRIEVVLVDVSKKDSIE